MLSRRYKTVFGEFIAPVNLALRRLRVSADHLTLAGLVFGALAGLAFGQGRTLTAALFLALSGLSDMLDGSLARAAGEATAFGSFIDSVTDRYTESFVFAGLAWHFRGGWELLLVLAAYSGSLLVSYSKARAEGVIGRCEVGLLERPERLILLIAGALTALVVPALWAVAVLGHVTALQRIHYTWKNAPRA
jgi:archaetidylinositol phosphate synthase